MPLPAAVGATSPTPGASGSGKEALPNLEEAGAHWLDPVQTPTPTLTPEENWSEKGHAEYSFPSGLSVNVWS